MNPFNRLPNSPASPPGRERWILRIVPRVFVLGTAVPALLAVALRQWPWVGEAADIEAMIGRYDFMLLGLLFLFWSLLAVVGIGAFVVMVMKGPGYVADGYRVPDADQPQPTASFTDDPQEQRPAAKE